ncbi:hypothetical protein DUK53_07430 [Listeria sp. SHR_NRA_18]|uniref:hypothetical protein n=1 Tax=Listeria sp. SHR_NRA_18 TaxID=2269046 RepID=UPI00051DC637|nr:hypothetical protein [Listeria sp. SHR_NRA_18]KGL39468.1 hypothetical protein EP56_12955 [Listeriaceae bacterium FSL A5-0209]RQW67016.1 hypothetical protein DUK53_07430 [Listeria sp. SHR_NRA_18]
MRKKELKKFITAFALGSALLSIPLVTAYASVSQNVDISMQHEVTNGAKNNKYHKLSKGYANLKLSVAASGAATPTVTVSLMKEKFGFDTSYGKRNFIPGKKWSSKTTTHQYYVDGNSSSYYLVAEKSGRYYEVRATGTLKNK